MTDFANPLPVRVIAEMLGIPGEDQRSFEDGLMTDFFGNAAATVETARRAQNSLVSLMEEDEVLTTEERQM